MEAEVCVNCKLHFLKFDLWVTMHCLRGLESIAVLLTAVTLLLRFFQQRGTTVAEGVVMRVVWLGCKTFCVAGLQQKLHRMKRNESNNKFVLSYHHIWLQERRYQRCSGGIRS